jgi:hypothetical protein
MKQIQPAGSMSFFTGELLIAVLLPQEIVGPRKDDHFR